MAEMLVTLVEAVSLLIKQFKIVFLVLPQGIYCVCDTHFYFTVSLSHFVVFFIFSGRLSI